MKINGAVLRGLRKHNNLSQEKLAEIVDVSTSTISQWECEVKRIKEPHLQSLANYFNVHVSTLTNELNDLPTHVLSRDELYKKENILLEKLMQSFEEYAQEKNMSYDMYRHNNVQEFKYDQEEDRTY